MSSKIFLFTREELLQIKNKETKAIALSGKTWEEAMRFMCKQKFGTFISKLDSESNIIGYEISWLEKEEREAFFKHLSSDAKIALEEMEFDDDFIDAWIEKTRAVFRKAVK